MRDSFGGEGFWGGARALIRQDRRLDSRLGRRQR